MMKTPLRFGVEPRTRAIGADVHGVDLGAVDDETFVELKAALHEHLVLFFHDQTLSPQSQIAFAKRFGETEVHEYFQHLEDHPEVSVLENDEARPPISDSWHSDVTYRPEPSMASVLYARDIPPRGGDTLWLSAYAACEALSEPMRTMLEGLTAEHDYLHAYRRLIAKQENAEEKLAQAARDVPPVRHPVIVKHPVTGKPLLYVNRTFTTRIVELSAAESRAVLDLLFEHLVQPDFQVRFKWREDDVAMWDNRATQHYATGDYYPDYRRMHRVTVGGDAPVAFRQA